MELQPIIISAGLAIGVLIGFTGMGGGGALMTPFLILTRVRPSVAVGTDFPQMMFTKFFGTWQHHHWGSVNYRLVLPIISGSLQGAFLGVVLLVVLRDNLGVSMDVFLTGVLGGILTLVGIVLLFRLLLRRWLPHRLESWEGLSLDGKGSLLLTGLGVSVGLVMGITSVGYGTLLIVILTVLFRVFMRTIMGTNVPHSAIFTSGAGTMHLGFGNVGLVLAANTLVGSIPGVVMGSRLTAQVPERGLRAVVALALMVVGLKLP